MVTTLEKQRDALKTALEYWQTYIEGSSPHIKIDDFGPGRIDVNNFKEAKEALALKPWLKKEVDRG